MVTYILTTFGADWLIFVDATELTNSRANNFTCSGSIMTLIQDLISIYIVAKFGNDWSLFADARVKQSLIWQIF